MDEQAKKVLDANVSACSDLVCAYPVFLPVSAVAELLHIKPEALRASIDQGRCPFGFSWKLGERAAYKIPTVTFCAWFLGRPVA